MIRTNIELLAPYAPDIAKCESVKDYEKIFFNGGVTESIKGAAGENFFDELCVKHSSITGFTATESRPSTPDEDYYDGVDTIGKMLKLIDGVQDDAVRQDKFYNPYIKDTKITIDKVWNAATKIITGEIKPGRVLLCTNLYDRQIDIKTKQWFPWRVTRDNFEQTLNGNAEFFRNLAKRIIDETAALRQLHNSIIESAIEDLSTYKPMPFQTAAVRHALKNSTSFTQLPPGSGKTNIQREVIAKWFDDCPLQVYIAPTLDLLDQNFYKVALYCKAKGIDFDVAMICSRKTFTTNKGEKAFLKDDEIVCGTDYSLIQDIVTSGRKTLIGITYASYQKLVKVCKELGIVFDRIADEALEIVPGKELYKEAKDADEEKSRWHTFADMSVVNRSASYDAFKKEAKADTGPGTNNKSVFGTAFSKTFGHMIDLGTIVPLQLRVIKVSHDTNSKHHREWWNDEDKLNFNALCYALEDLLNDNDFENKKMVAFLHNAQICREFKEPLADYLQDKIDYVESIIAGTNNRPELLQAYKKAKDAVVLNYGVLGKGFDDDSTPAVFVARNMASVYGMHGIHRGCRSHNSEYGLSPELHIIKPFGIAYVIVVEDDKKSITEHEDLRAMLDMLYGIGWTDNVKLVKPAKPRKPKDKPNDPPQPDPELIDWTADPELFKVMSIYKDNIVDRQEKVKYNKLVDEVLNIDKDENFIDNLLKLTA